MPRATVSALVIAVLAAAAAHAGESTIAAGKYLLTYRLELPHVERWAVEKTATVCLAGAAAANAVPVPVLSANTPFAACRARDVRHDGRQLAYEIVCPGRGAARAAAVYTIGTGGFSGRVAMVMGAKNMTMTEVQAGRRLGGCDLAGLPR